MLSKKSFRGTAQIFLEALMRWSENDVGGHIIYRISTGSLRKFFMSHCTPGYWFRRAHREKFSVRSVLPFSTASVKRYRAIRRWCGSMSPVPRKRPNRGQIADDAKGQQRPLNKNASIFATARLLTDRSKLTSSHSWQDRGNLIVMGP